MPDAADLIAQNYGLSVEFFAAYVAQAEISKALDDEIPKKATRMLVAGEQAKKNPLPKKTKTNQCTCCLIIIISLLECSVA